MFPFRTVEDFREWTNWLFYRGGIGVKGEESWEAWWDSELVIQFSMYFFIISLFFFSFSFFYMNFNAMLVRSVLNNSISSLSMQQCYGYKSMQHFV